ncbi:MAG: SRPBCC family protein [Bacteroidetes bacterium SB0662_bin_6]|nr:SRPBCC family protein [Bacteroidetes bacterium SB0668_bin_1]MYE05280.1 SRPBCC family protein [Bacteroidetes bacterium SB0662_bin_6]
MTRTAVSRTIDAAPEVVFSIVSDISNYSEAVPHLVRVEFLTDQKVGVGARFRETRVMRSREATTEIEVTEFVANERVRMVSDEGGTIWDTVFTVTPLGDGDGTRLDMVMDARPYRILSRLMAPLIKGVVAKAIAADMDAVKAYCEGGGASVSPSS